MDIILVFKKKSPESRSRFRHNSMHLTHGKEAWAQVVGQPERIKVYFNRYLPEDVSWFKRWVFSIEELRETKKPFTDDESHRSRVCRIHEQESFSRLLARGFMEPSV